MSSNSKSKSQKDIPKYRAASWWILWEDLIYPDKGIEEKIIQKAAAFKAAGIDTAVIFGAHFRWDYIYIWDRLHELFKFIADALHEHDIKLIDHHSANLTHRPPTSEQRWNVYERNRHHVPFYPSKEMADTLMFNGVKLNEFRMESVRTGMPCYLPAYEAEIFCMNNQKYREAYSIYLKKLFQETGIDGLMCDDVIYYPGWEGCGCSFCREKFYDIYGRVLPDSHESDFWGNYEFAGFKDWVEMRYNDSADFLAMVRDTIGAETPLMSCCSASVGKFLNKTGLSSQILARSANHLMLEMCGEIAVSGETMLARVPDIMLHQSLSVKNGFPNIGLGYPHFPDSAFLTWSFNKLVGTSSWISTLKGRLGIPEKDIQSLPDESDIVGEGYLFEKNNPELFKGRSAAKIALYFSYETQLYYGISDDDYVTSYRNIVQTLFRSNIQFDVVEDIPAVNEYPFLLLVDVHCLSDKLREEIIRYIEAGGEVAGSGPLGLRDERGSLTKESFLSSFGIKAAIAEPEQKITVETFFEPGKYPPVERNIPSACEGVYDNQQVKSDSWIEIKKGKGLFSWIPGRCLDKNIIKKVIKKITDDFGDTRISLHFPQGWLYRMYENGSKVFIHGLSNNFDAVFDTQYQNKFTGQYLVKNILYKTGGGDATVSCSSRKARLFSPDITGVRKGTVQDKNLIFNLQGISRYFVIVVDVI